MSATTVVPVGRAFDMEVDVVYALPARACRIHVFTATGVISVGPNGTDWDAITLDTNKEFETGAAFIKSATGESTIVAKTL